MPLPFLVPDQYPILPERAPSGSTRVRSSRRQRRSRSPIPIRPFDPAAGIMNLDHLVFVVQENRSFDHYFGTFPGADGIPTEPDGSFDVCVPDPARTLPPPYHDRNRSIAVGRTASTRRRSSIDGGRMNGFVRALRIIKGNGCENDPDDAPVPEDDARARQARSPT